MLFAVFLAPVIIPGFALLGLLPRFIMRKNDARTSIGPVSIAMTINWSSVVVLALAHRGIGDSGSVDSNLAGILSCRDDLQDLVWLGAAILLVTSYIAALVFATTAIERRAAMRMNSWVVGIIVVLIPVLFAGGIKLVDVLGTAQMQAALVAQEKEWESTNRSLIPLRQDIAEEGWTIACCGTWEDARSGDAPGDLLESMQIAMSVALEATPEVAFDKLKTVIDAHGWAVSDSAVERPAPAPTPDPAATASASPSPSPLPRAPGVGEEWTGTITAVDGDKTLTVTVKSLEQISQITLHVSMAPRPAEPSLDFPWWRLESREEQRNRPSLQERDFRYDQWPTLLEVVG